MQSMVRRVNYIVLSKMRKNSVVPMKLFFIVFKKKLSGILKKNQYWLGPILAIQLIRSEFTSTTRGIF